MTVLAVLGTNRRSGLITKLCSALLEGASSKGCKTEMINLYDYHIEPCKGCWACVQKGACVQEDDFFEAYKKILDADVIVLASPCYWGNVAGIMKNFIDRHTGYAMVKPQNASGFAQMRFIEKVKTLLMLMKSFGAHPQVAKKRFVIITAMTVPFPVSYLSGDLHGTVGAMKTYVKNLNGKLLYRLAFTDSLFRFQKHKERRYTKRAYRLGRSLSPFNITVI